jgi:hypothetical protein
MILTGESEILKRKTCPTVTLSTTNPTWIGLGSRLGLQSERYLCFFEVAVFQHEY